MKKYLITLKGDAKTLAFEVNRLHAEISTLMISTLEKAVRAGELLTELKLRIGHGGWRSWVEKNLDFSYRTARRYVYVYNNRHRISGIKTVHAAQGILAKEEDANSADHAKIRRSLVSPVRLVRARLRKLAHMGGSSEMIEAIMEELRAESQGLLSDLEESKRAF